MKANRSVWSEASGWTHEAGGAAAGEVDLALVFGSTGPMIASRLSEIRARYPNAYVCGGSTAGEIVGKEVRDDSVVVTAIKLERSELRAAEVTIENADDSLAAGRQLANAIPHAGLVHTFVLSDGLGVNGTDLVQGLCVLPSRGRGHHRRPVGRRRALRPYLCLCRRLRGRTPQRGDRFLRRSSAGRLQHDGGVGPFRARAARHPGLGQRPLRAGRAERAGALQAVPGRARQEPAGQRPAVPADGARSDHRRERHARRGRDRRRRAEHGLRW